MKMIRLYIYYHFSACQLGNHKLLKCLFPWQTVYPDNKIVTKWTLVNRIKIVIFSLPLLNFLPKTF